MAQQEQYTDFGYHNGHYDINTTHRTGSAQTTDATVAGAKAKDVDTTFLASISQTKEERDLGDVVQPRPSSTSEAPNGGLKAWLQVLGAHLLFFNSWYDLPATQNIFSVAPEL